MTDANPMKPDFSPDELDEAAVWVARLHAPERTAVVERGFRRWLAEKPAHAAALETISTAWDLTGALQRRPFPKLTRWERAGFRSGFLRGAAAIVAVTALAILGVMSYIGASGYTTGIGEQRVLTLDDGTRITLNTSSRLVVHYNQKQRRVDLKEGEAIFEVAKSAGWPFIVVARDRQVRALGTEFMVRSNERQLSVTLVEGKVTVSKVGTTAAEANVREQGTSAGTQPDDFPAVPQGAGTVQEETFTLIPGQRLTLSPSTLPRLDTPSIERLSAWRLGHVELDDAPLSDAAAEMNRYSTTKLVVERPEAAVLRINGVFRAGDTSGFAAAVAKSYGLKLERHSHELLLSGIPAGRLLPQSREK